MKKTEKTKQTEKEVEIALKYANYTNKTMVGRELKMIELKKEIEELKNLSKRD